MGQTFHKWLEQLKNLGYAVEWRELVAADYGAPTTRKRFFLIARHDGRPIVWPKPTHAPADSPEVKSGKKKPWRSAAEIIDWSLPCPSIFDSRAEIKEKYGLSAQRPAEEVTALLDGLLTRQKAELSAAAAAHTAAQAQLDALQQTLGRAEQAEALRRQRVEKQAELAALLPRRDAARADAARHAGDAAALDALTAQLERARAGLDACDALDKLCRAQTAARSEADLEQAKARKARAQLTALDAELAALDAEAAALGDPETRNVALTAQAEHLTRRETALTALAQSLTEDQRRTHAARQAQDAYRTAAAAQEAAHAERDACERAFLDAQAGLLAQGLAESTPCPVCGSVHHPAKAALPHTAPTQAQVTAAKQAAEAADREAQDRAAAAREALAAQREGKATLRRDAESLLPERFTSPEGPVALTVALLKTALAEETAALQTAQAENRTEIGRAHV